MECAECEGEINLETDHYYKDGDPPFWICRECAERTAENWELDKQALRAEGHEIPCKWARENLGMGDKDA